MKTVTIEIPLLVAQQYATYEDHVEGHTGTMRDIYKQAIKVVEEREARSINMAHDYYRAAAMELLASRGESGAKWSGYISAALRLAELARAQERGDD